MEELIPLFGIFGTIVLPILVFGYIYYRKQKNNHEERMRMIEQGMRPDTRKEPVTEKQKHKSLESGVFFTMVALGLLVGYLLKIGSGMDGVLAFFISIPLFVGLGNVGLYLYLKNDKETKSVEE